MNVVILGLSAGVIVTAAVEALKRLFPQQLAGNRPIAAAIVVAEVLVLGEHAAGLYPVFGEWWHQALAGLLVALSAMGLFDAGDGLVSAVRARTGPPGQ